MWRSYFILLTVCNFSSAIVLKTLCLTLNKNLYYCVEKKNNEREKEREGESSVINSLRINLFYLECVKRPENLHPLRMAKTHLIPDTAATAAVTRRRGVGVWAGAVPLPAAVANAVAAECINLEGKTTCAARELLKAKTGKENFGEQVAKLRLCARGCQCCQYAGLERANTHTYTGKHTTAVPLQALLCLQPTDNHLNPETTFFGARLASYAK